MRISPLYDRVVIVPQEAESHATLTIKSQTNELRGTIRAVGQGHLMADGSVTKLAVEPGDTVVYDDPQAQGILMKDFDGVEVVVIRESHVVAVLNESPAE